MSKILLLILTAVFGLFFLAFGVAGVALEYQVPPVHTSHLIGFGFSILLGSILMPGVGAIIIARLKDGVTLAAPFIPRVGGRRDYDPVVPQVQAKPDGDAKPGGPA